MEHEIKKSNEPSVKLTERLMNSLQITRSELLRFDAETSFRAIILSEEPNFGLLVRRGDTPKLTKTIAGVAAIFLTDNFPDQDNRADMALNFANTIIRHEPTWEIGDVINFFNFVVRRQDLDSMKIFGNRITPIRLMEMVVVYNEFKAEEREKIMTERKFTINAQRESTDNSLKAIMGKELERIQIRDDDKKPIKIAPDENFFEPKID